MRAKVHRHNIRARVADRILAIEHNVVANLHAPFLKKFFEPGAAAGLHRRAVERDQGPSALVQVMINFLQLRGVEWIRWAGDDEQVAVGWNFFRAGQWKQMDLKIILVVQESEKSSVAVRIVAIREALAVADQIIRDWRAAIGDLVDF